jgi:hypothetical protein
MLGVVAFFFLRMLLLQLFLFTHGRGYILPHGDISLSCLSSMPLFNFFPFFFFFFVCACVCVCMCVCVCACVCVCVRLD